MREASPVLFRASRTCSRAAVAVALLVLACALGGCAAGGGPGNSFAMAGGGGSGATVAFESIDGPPPQVFDRMVGVLDSESKLRNLSIVSREGQAAYRVRALERHFQSDRAAERESDHIDARRIDVLAQGPQGARQFLDAASGLQRRTAAAPRQIRYDNAKAS